MIILMRIVSNGKKLRINNGTTGHIVSMAVRFGQFHIKTVSMNKICLFSTFTFPSVPSILSPLDFSLQTVSIFANQRKPCNNLNDMLDTLSNTRTIKINVVPVDLGRSFKQV